MPPPNQPSRTKIPRLLYQVLLFIFFFIFFFHSSISPDNLFTRTISFTTNYLDKQIERFITNRNFLSNFSFEKAPSSSDQIPNWNYSGWQLNSDRASSGKQSVSSLNLVINPLHEIKQTVYFYFPGQSRLKLTLNSLSEVQGAKVNISLTAHHLDFSTTKQNLENDLSISTNWEAKDYLFTLGKDAYRLDLAIAVNHLGPQPIYLDDISLTILIAKQLNSL